MTHSIRPLVLLAQRDRWERLGDRFGGHATYQWSDVMIWGGILAVLAIALFWFARYSKHHDTPRVSRSPHGLFRELCRAHGLDRASRRLLKQIAVRYGMPQPAALFLEPDRFDSKRLPESLAADRAQIDALRNQLFAIDEGEEK